jgi:hypothetical protein
LGNRRSINIAGIILGLALTGAATAQAPDPLVAFAVAVEECKGHLVASRELYVGSDRGRAALHAAHPVQEIGNRLIGPVKRVDSALAESLRIALKAPGGDLEHKVSASRYSDTVAATFNVLDSALERVVPAPLRTDLGFQTRVLAALIRALVGEYEEGVKDGRVTQVVEYQDAYGFFRRAQELSRAVDRAARAKNAAAAQRLQDEMAVLARTFSAVGGPGVTLTVHQLKERADSIVIVLQSLGGS